MGEHLVSVTLLASLVLAGTPLPLRRLTDLPGDERDLRFSPDGRSIAFTSDPDGRRELFVVPASGGTPRRLWDAPGGVGRLEWSPDGRRIACEVSDEGGANLWIVGVDDGAGSRLTPAAERVARPLWSPDGSELAFGCHDGSAWQICTGRPGEEAHRSLTTGPGDKYPFGWSPDGRSIGFNQRGAALEELFSVAAADSRVVRLTHHDGHEWYPSWSPDGERVLFYSTWGDAMTDVWALELSDGRLTSLADHPAEDYAARWSPDGRSVVFVSKRAETEDVYLVAAGGGEAIPLEVGARVPPGWPRWAPDGRAVAWTASDEREHVYAVDLAGDAPRRLLEGPASARDPALSPDGRSLAYDSDRFGNEGAVLVTRRSDGSTVSLFVGEPGQENPSWSPDGRWLAYSQATGGSPTSAQVWISSPDGGVRRQLTDSGGFRDVAWCGNERIAFSRDPGALYTYDIGLLDVATGDVRMLVETPASERVSDCSSDGERLLFHRERDGRNDLYELTLSALRERVLETGLRDGEGARYSQDGSRAAFVSRDNPEGQPDLYVVPLEGGRAQRVTRDRARESWPRWQADDGAFVFSANRGNDDIWIVDVGPVVDQLRSR